MMTNEEAKQEAIRKAFCDKWDLFTDEYKNHLLTKKHWVDMSIKYGALSGLNYYKSPTPQILTYNNEIEINCEFWRPISLKGIEDNNGWTRIEPDDSNIPTEPDTYMGYSPTVGEVRCCKTSLKSLFKNGTITHFRIYTEHHKPIY